MFAPLTTDPVAGVEVVPAGAPAAFVVVCVVPVAGDDGVVLAHPAIAMVITTKMIIMTPVRKIFTFIPPGFNGNALTTLSPTGIC